MVSQNAKMFTMVGFAVAVHPPAPKPEQTPRKKVNITLPKRVQCATSLMCRQRLIAQTEQKFRHCFFVTITNTAQSSGPTLFTKTESDLFEDRRRMDQRHRRNSIFPQLASQVSLPWLIIIQGTPKFFSANEPP